MLFNLVQIKNGPAPTEQIELLCRSRVESMLNFKNIVECQRNFKTVIHSGYNLKS